MQYTISDIAKRCGVSKATVSRVINNKSRGVGAETKERVLKAIEELNYRPNTLARSVAVSRSKTIGMLIPDISYVLYNQLVRGVDDTIAAKDYMMLLCNTDSDPARERSKLLSFIDKRVDGVIICSGVSNDAFLKEYKKYNTPFVLIGRSFDSYVSDGSVTGDNFAGTLEAMRLLIGNGNRRIAYLDGTPGISGTMQKFEGYKQALAAEGIVLDPALIKQGDYTVEFGYQSVCRLLEDGVAFSAVFSGSDTVAVGATKALLERGKNIPEEIEVIGFDAIEMSETFEPRITSVAKPHYEMATEAARMLLSFIDGQPSLMRHITVQPTLLHRETTKKPML